MGEGQGPQRASTRTLFVKRSESASSARDKVFARLPWDPVLHVTVITVRFRGPGLCVYVNTRSPHCSCSGIGVVLLCRSVTEREICCCVTVNRRERNTKYGGGNRAIAALESGAPPGHRLAATRRVVWFFSFDSLTQTASSCFEWWAMSCVGGFAAKIINIEHALCLYPLRQDGRVLTIKIYRKICGRPSKFADQNLRWPGSKPVLYFGQEKRADVLQQAGHRRVEILY